VEDKNRRRLFSQAGNICFYTIIKYLEFVSPFSFYPAPYSEFYSAIYGTLVMQTVQVSPKENPGRLIQVFYCTWCSFRTKGFAHSAIRYHRDCFVFMFIFIFMFIFD